MNSERILVTGSSGLVGYAVASYLTHKGESVIGLDQPGTKPPDADFPVVEADLNDVHHLYHVLSAYKIDTIVHCGAISGPMLARDRPYAICNTNVIGTINILEAARVATIRRLVYCSSISVYGTTPTGSISEATPMHPTSVYGASKAAGDLLLQSYATQHGVDAIALRISCVFGPRRRTDCLIRTVIENALDGLPTRCEFGSGFRRQYVYVDDVVSAIAAALQVDHVSQRAYNITGGTWLTLDEVVDVVKQVVPEADVSLAPGDDPMDDIQHPFDISAAATDLGYQPQFSLKQGVQAYYNWICQQRTKE